MKTPYIDRTNIISKYKERRQGRNVLLFGRDTEADAHSRAQIRTMYDGDLLVQGDVLVSYIPARSGTSVGQAHERCPGMRIGLYISHAWYRYYENRTSNSHDGTPRQSPLYPCLYVSYHTADLGD